MFYYIYVFFFQVFPPVNYVSLPPPVAFRKMNRHIPTLSTARWPTPLCHQCYIDSPHNFHRASICPHFTPHDSRLRSKLGLCVTARLYERGHWIPSQTHYLFSWLVSSQQLSFHPHINRSYHSPTPWQTASQVHIHTVPQYIVPARHVFLLRSTVHSPTLT